MRMPVAVRMSVPVTIFMPMLMRKFMPMIVIVIVIVIVPTVIVSCHQTHLTLVVPATTYSSPATRVVAPPHNTVKFV